MVKFTLKFEKIDDEQFHIVKTGDDGMVIDETSLPRISSSKIGIGRYLVVGAKVREFKSGSFEEAVKWLSQLDGSLGKPAGSPAEEYRVYRL
jgi:hypothetical protein